MILINKIIVILAAPLSQLSKYSILAQHTHDDTKINVTTNDVRFLVTIALYLRWSLMAKNRSAVIAVNESKVIGDTNQTTEL